MEIKLHQSHAHAGHAAAGAFQSGGCVDGTRNGESRISGKYAIYKTRHDNAKRICNYSYQTLSSHNYAILFRSFCISAYATIENPNRHSRRYAMLLLFEGIPRSFFAWSIFSPCL